MLRVLSERRIWAVAAFIALALALGLSLWGMPHLTAHASRLVSERLGVDVQIEKTSSCVESSYVVATADSSRISRRSTRAGVFSAHS